MSDSSLKVRRRKTLRRQDARAVIEEAQKKVEIQYALKIEEAETEDGTRIYLLDNEIFLFKVEGEIYPTLRCPCTEKLPAVIVDMGAIPFVCKGADVMAPGITEIKMPFNEGQTVVVRDIRYSKALAIGKALKSSVEIMAEKKGKVIKNLHYVGDKIWVAWV